MSRFFPALPRRLGVDCPAILPAHLILVSFCFCQIGDKPSEKQSPLVPADQIPPSPPLSPQDSLKTFLLAAGFSGLEALAAPLLDSEGVFGPPERPVRIVLHGARGPIRVLGKMDAGDMPPMQAAFNDETDLLDPHLFQVRVGSQCLSCKS
jgi:hypothetical protein